MGKLLNSLIDFIFGKFVSCKKRKRRERGGGKGRRVILCALCVYVRFRDRWWLVLRSFVLVVTSLCPLRIPKKQTFSGFTKNTKKAQRTQSDCQYPDFFITLFIVSTLIYLSREIILSGNEASRHPIALNSLSRYCFHAIN